MLGFSGLGLLLPEVGFPGFFSGLGALFHTLLSLFLMREQLPRMGIMGLLIWHSSRPLLPGLIMHETLLVILRSLGPALGGLLPFFG